MSNQSERRYRKLNRRQCAELIKQLPLPHPAAKPAAPQKVEALPSKQYVTIWMRNRFDQFMDCGEVQATQLVESFGAEHPQCSHWLDDSLHWVWDIPIDIELKLR